MSMLLDTPPRWVETNGMRLIGYDTGMVNGLPSFDYRTIPVEGEYNTTGVREDTEYPPQLYSKALYPYSEGYELIDHAETHWLLLNAEEQDTQLGELINLDAWQKRYFLNKYELSPKADGVFIPGRWRYRETLLSMAKAGSKTTTSAIELLTMLDLAPELGNHKIFIISGGMRQAGLTFDIIKEQIKSNPYYRERYNVVRDTIYKLDSEGQRIGDSFIQKISSNAKALDGQRPWMILADELGIWHEGTTNRKDELLWNRLLTSGISAKMITAISTASDGRASVWQDKIGKAENIFEGKETDDSFFFAIYKTPKEDNPTDNLNGYRYANPRFAYGGISEEDMATMISKIGSEAWVKRYYGNWEASPEGETYISRKDFYKHTLQPDELETLLGGPDFGAGLGREVVVGVDLGFSKDDSVMVVQDLKTGIFWIGEIDSPEETPEATTPEGRLESSHPEDWKSDHDIIWNAIKNLNAVKGYNIRMVAIDNSFVHQMESSLMKDLAPFVQGGRKNIHTIPQSPNRIAQISRGFLLDYFSDPLYHPASPTLQRHIQNAVQTKDLGVGKNSGAKTDTLMAALFANDMRRIILNRQPILSPADMVNTKENNK